MKIGILAYRQYPFISANTSIAYTLGKYIAEHTDNEVVYIGRFQNESQRSVCEHEGIPIRFFNSSPKDIPGRIQNYTRRVFGEDVGYSEESATLKKIIKDESVDALICVIAPADDLYIVSKANLNIPTIVYQLDPFYNVNDVVNSRLKKNFIKIVSGERIKHIFTTDLLYEEYRQNKEFSEVLKKFSVVQFPKLKKPESITANIGEHSKTTLLYAGSLYRTIRSPEILAKLCKSLPEKAEIVFCGGCDNQEDVELLKKAGVVCKGYLSQAELSEEYKKADILVNIGNLVKNQLGSKLIDYIAIGKPILNISQIVNCPTVKVLDNYNLKLSLFADELLDSKSSICEFINKSKGQTIPFDEIRKRYEEYTPEYVCTHILEKLK